jgi:hypothetical protein
MADFRRDYIMEYFPRLTKEERARLLQQLPAEERLEDLPPEVIEAYLQKVRERPTVSRRKSRRKR